MRNLITIEQQKEVYPHIGRFTTTKKKSSNIKYIDIPIDNNIPFDKFPKNLPDKEWRWLDQSEDIERCINKRNSLHLHQAHGTTCTIKPLKSLLGANSITQFGDNILQGTANLNGLGLTNLQKIYFQEIKKQSGTLNSPITSIISITDMKNGLKQWIETHNEISIWTTSWTL